MEKNFGTGGAIAFTFILGFQPQAVVSIKEIRG